MAELPTGQPKAEKELRNQAHLRWMANRNRKQESPSYQDSWWRQQCGACRFWIPLSGLLGSDFGACASDESVFDGQIRFEHDGCDEFRAAAEWGQPDLDPGDGPPPKTEEPLLNFDLTKLQRDVLISGLIDWGGPSRCSDDMAKAMGFESVDDLFQQTDRLTERLRHSDGLSEVDWARALLSTEVCFASSLGSRGDWRITTGFGDAETIQVIRDLQRILAPVTAKLRRAEPKSRE